MSKQVLVVDDESVTRRVVSYTLKSMDITVLNAENGTQALEIALSNPLALAIVDLNLPDMDGFEVIRQLKTHPHLQEVPMLIFTARNHPGDEETAYEAGASDFLYKPFSTQELRELVKKHLA